MKNYHYLVHKLSVTVVTVNSLRSEKWGKKTAGYNGTRTVVIIYGLFLCLSFYMYIYNIHAWLLIDLIMLQDAVT